MYSCRKTTVYILYYDQTKGMEKFRSPGHIIVFWDLTGMNSLSSDNDIMSVDKSWINILLFTNDVIGVILKGL